MAGFTFRKVQKRIMGRERPRVNCATAMLKLISAAAWDIVMLVGIVSEGIDRLLFSKMSARSFDFYSNEILALVTKVMSTAQVLVPAQCRGKARVLHIRLLIANS